MVELIPLLVRTIPLGRFVVPEEFTITSGISFSYIASVVLLVFFPSEIKVRHRTILSEYGMCFFAFTEATILVTAGISSKAEMITIFFMHNLGSIGCILSNSWSSTNIISASVSFTRSMICSCVNIGFIMFATAPIRHMANSEYTNSGEELVNIITLSLFFTRLAINAAFVNSIFSNIVLYVIFFLKYSRAVSVKWSQLFS